MKAYGKDRAAVTNRNLPGTTRPCPCCEPKSARRKAKSFRKRARQQAAKECTEKL